MPPDAAHGDRPLVLLGVAEGKRVRLMQAARMQLGLAPARVLEWRDWLDRPALLDAALAQPCVFKIETPGDDSAVHLRMLQDGCRRLGRAAPAPPAHGELVAADAWFAGLTAALEQLGRQLAALPAAQVLNAPGELLAMTDKLACQQHLARHGVAVPMLLGPVSGHAHLQALLDQHGLNRAYLKPRYGSSAAGVVAYRRDGRGRAQATTSAQLVRGDGATRLFNVKRICRYDAAADIAELVDLLAQQQLYAEAWLSKPRAGDQHFDLRVVTLGGQPAHRVARLGARMMTNLHLDNQRGDVDALLDTAGQQALEQCARQAAAVFPGSHVIGFDLVVRRGQAHVLEANCFGDLLPGLLWRGRDTYAAQLHKFFDYARA